MPPNSGTPSIAAVERRAEIGGGGGEGVRGGGIRREPELLTPYSCDMEKLMKTKNGCFVCSDMETISSRTILL